MTRIITVAREYGSGGGEIARRVAETLGWELVDRRLIEEVARLARIRPEEAEALDERVNPWAVRLAKGLWSGSADSFAAIPQGIVDADVMAELTRRVILDAAAAGACVIIGRGGQCILRDRSDALHVFVYAPRADRLRRVRSRFESESAAVAALERIDRARAAYVHYYYGCDRTSRESYDLMVNSRLDVERAARVILCAAGQGPGAP